MCVTCVTDPRCLNDRTIFVREPPVAESSGGFLIYIKRSSPLISAVVQSSEGLCYGILGSLRQETSALLPTAPARLCKSSASLLRMHSRFTQTRSTYRTDGPRAVTFVPNVTLPTHDAQLRWSSSKAVKPCGLVLQPSS